MKEVTEKLSLVQQGIHMADLESLYGVQVSICTSTARQVQLRGLLADGLPGYVAGLITKPRFWKSLTKDHNIPEALRKGDLRA